MNKVVIPSAARDLHFIAGNFLKGLRFSAADWLLTTG
jgi:hypothetical protein